MSNGRGPIPYTHRMGGFCMAQTNIEALRELAVDYMTGRKGKNSYTQGGKRTYFFG